LLLAQGGDIQHRFDPVRLSYFICHSGAGQYCLRLIFSACGSVWAAEKPTLPAELSA
jgi:hypothetical protein